MKDQFFEKRNVYDIEPTNNNKNKAWEREIRNKKVRNEIGATTVDITKTEIIICNYY